MKRYIDKDALVAEIKKLIKKNELYLDDNVSDAVRFQKTGAYSVLNDLLHFLDTLKVKEVQEETESIWHDANRQPIMYRNYLVRYSDSRVSGSWERHDDGFIPWKDVVKEHGFTHWCYVEDLIKL